MKILEPTTFINDAYGVIKIKEEKNKTRVYATMYIQPPWFLYKITPLKVVKKISYTRMKKLILNFQDEIKRQAKLKQAKPVSQ